MLIGVTAQLNRIPREIYVLLAWVATRLPLYLMDSGHLPDHWHADEIGDTSLYASWAAQLHGGQYPATSDVYWQYPPAVALALLVPRHLATLMGVSYAIAFMRLMVLADLAVTVLLVVLARRRGRWAGAGFWVIAVPLLGPLVFARFDLLTALAVAAFFASRSPFVAGMFGGVGAALKLWPAVVSAGAHGSRGRLFKVGGGLVAGAVVASALPMLFIRGGLGFLHAEAGRGVQIETVAAFPFLIDEHVHRGEYANDVAFGSVEVLGRGTAYVAAHLIFLTAALLSALAATMWRYRARRRESWSAEATLVALLILLVTSKVLSPQYMIWAAVVAAVCLTYPGHRQTATVRCLLVVFALTVLEYPIGFSDVIASNGAGIEIVGLRNGALIVALVLAWRGLLRAGGAAEPGAEPLLADQRHGELLPVFNGG